MNELMVATNADRTPIEVLLQVGEDERVSARDTHRFLGLSIDNFTRWCNVNIVENQFAIENDDYYAVVLEEDAATPTGNSYIRTMIDYRLSIPFAKKICMMSKSQRGEQARDYFVKVEDTLKQVAKNLPALTANEMILQIAQANVELERQLGEVKDEVKQLGGKFEGAMKAFAAPGGDWASSMNVKISELAPEGWANIKLKGKMYAELESIANVDLTVRQKRMRTRMKKQGATHKECIAITKLDVISKDKQLKQIFSDIVKRYQAVNT